MVYNLSMSKNVSALKATRKFFSISSLSVSVRVMAGHRSPSSIPGGITQGDLNRTAYKDVGTVKETKNTRDDRKLVRP